MEAKEESGHANHLNVMSPETQFSRQKPKKFEWCGERTCRMLLRSERLRCEGDEGDREMLSGNCRKGVTLEGFGFSNWRMLVRRYNVW